MNLRDALAFGTHLLTADDSLVRDDTPQLDADVLLRFAAGVERAALFGHPERALTREQERRYRELLARRAQAEPVAYVTGHKEFMGIDFLVDRHVLIPRPETELLVERALGFLAAEGSGNTAVDVGTGSGAIALSLAYYRPRLRVVATDCSADSLALAAVNARRLGLAGRVQFLQGDLLEPVDEPLDLIAANLPYIPTQELPALPPSVARYEPLAALDGGDGGLEPHRRLFAQLNSRAHLLRTGAVLLFECDCRNAAALAALCRGHLPRAAVSVEKDLAGLDRMVIATTAAA